MASGPRAQRGLPRLSLFGQVARAYSALVVLSLHVALAANNDKFFADTKKLGESLLEGLMMLSGIGATIGFILAGQAFSSGDVERGKKMLKGTVVGAACIFGSASLVTLIQQKFGVRY